MECAENSYGVKRSGSMNYTFVGLMTISVIVWIGNRLLTIKEEQIRK
tara:strand:- start:459 stop:599 length:141 start_codon:yes stop_codon:yes gene_type:complete